MGIDAASLRAAHTMENKRMAGFLAYILPVDPGAHPDHGLPGAPPGIWGPTDPRPTPPIVMPIPPDAIAPGVPTHPIYIPVYPAHPIVIPPGSLGPGVPTHPIYLPPIIWGPNDPRPTPPIVIPPSAISPGVPTHPIYLPPGIWGGGNVPMPTPPIHIPPEPTEPPPGGGAKPPPETGGWGYHPDPGFGWGYYPAEGGDKPNPIPSPGDPPAKPT